MTATAAEDGDRYENDPTLPFDAETADALDEPLVIDEDMPGGDGDDAGDYSGLENLGIGELGVLVGIGLLVFDYPTIGMAIIMVGIAYAGWQALQADGDEEGEA